MSIRLMTRIWDSGAYSGGTLLVLLALADFAGDDGKRIFPHVDTLAKKARLSTRATQLALETLRDDGVIRPIANATGGRGKSVEYEMDIERVQKLRSEEKGAVSDTKGCNPPQERVQEKTERVQSATSYIEEPPEPSKTHQENHQHAASPRQGDLLNAGDPPPNQIAVVEVVFDPLERAREAYNEAVDTARARHGADWTACQTLNETRKKQLAKRLKECGGGQAWTELMQRATESPHLNGTAPRKPEFASWWPDFDFFLQPKSFTKLMEGFYDPKSGKAATSGGGSFLEAAGRVAARHSAGGS